MRSYLIKSVSTNINPLVCGFHKNEGSKTDFSQSIKQVRDDMKDGISDEDYRNAFKRALIEANYMNFHVQKK